MIFPVSSGLAGLTKVVIFIIFSIFVLMIYRAAYWISYGFLYLWSLWPLRVHYIFSDILCFLLRRVFKYRLPVVYTNISRAFPEMKYSEICSLAGEYYRFVSDVIAETIWSFSASRESIGRHISFEGKEELEKMHTSGRNTVALLAHHGNWELWSSMPDMKSFYGIDIPNDHYRFAYKRPENALADRLMLAIRQRPGSVRMVETNSIARAILSDRSRDHFYFFACDQYPAANTHIDLTFLNQKTGIISGPGEIARKLKMGVGYWSVRRTSRGHYTARFIPICEDASAHEPGFVAREYAKLLEKDIIGEKATWLWSHKRWK